MLQDRVFRIPRQDFISFAEGFFHFVLKKINSRTVRQSVGVLRLFRQCRTQTFQRRVVITLFDGGFGVLDQNFDRLTVNRQARRQHQQGQQNKIKNSVFHKSFSPNKSTNRCAKNLKNVFEILPARLDGSAAGFWFVNHLPFLTDFTRISTGSILDHFPSAQQRR